MKIRVPLHPFTVSNTELVVEDSLRFSLIVTTIARTVELTRFLDSLCAQTYRNFDVIIVDQNLDDRVQRIVSAFSGKLSIRRLESASGASRGRNTGLTHRAPADVVAFPDDDCWYPPDLLENVAKRLRDNPGWSGLTCRSVTETGQNSNGRWHNEGGRITLTNVVNRATMYSIFLREVATEGPWFNELMGGGAPSPWGGGEDLDYLIQVIRNGHFISFEPDIAVYHPEWSVCGYSDDVCKKAESYARGMGYLFRKHGFPLHWVLYHLIRPLGGTLGTLLRGNSSKASYHWAIFVGRLWGWHYGGNPLKWGAPASAPGAVSEQPVEGKFLFGKRLLQNTAALYAVQICRKLVPLVSIPYLTRVLGPASWGTIAFVVTSVYFLVLIVEFGFNISATREIASHRDSKEACAKIVAGVVGLQAFLFFAGVALLLPIAFHVPLLRENPHLFFAGIFFAFAQCFTPLWFFQGMEWMRSAAALEITGKLLALAGVFAFVHSPSDDWKVLTLQAIPFLLQSVAGIWFMYHSVPFRWPSVRLMRDAFSHGWTMFLFKSGLNLYTGANVFILGLFAGPIYVGYYATAERINSALLGLLNPIQDALFPRLSNLLRHSPKHAERLAVLGAILTAGAGIVLPIAVIWLAPQLISAFAGARFQPSVTVLRILALVMPFASISLCMGQQWLIPLRKDRVVTSIIVAGGLLNIALGSLMAPRFAQVGMAWTAVVSEASVGCMMLWAVLHYTSFWKSSLAVFSGSNNANSDTLADSPLAEPATKN